MVGLIAGGEAPLQSATIPAANGAIADSDLGFGSVVWLATQHEWDPLPKPKAWDKLARQLAAAVSDRNWDEAIQLSRALRAQLPKTIPDDYPWDGEDSRFQWNAAIGDLYLNALDFEGAAKEYRFVLEHEKSKSPMGHSVARQTARYGLALSLACVGKFDDAVVEEKAAPSEYWSGCGNCMQSEQALIYAVNLAWTTAAAGGPNRDQDLLELTNGRIKAEGMPKQDAAEEQWQRESIRPFAALALGQSYLRRGDKDNAIRLFKFAASCNLGPVSRVALAYTYKLDAKLAASRRRGSSGKGTK